MKKKNLKNLRLNKKSICNLQSTRTIIGGTANGNCTHGTCPSKGRNCPIIHEPSVIDINGCQSENGCTGGTDQTMTCANWSCGC